MGNTNAAELAAFTARLDGRRVQMLHELRSDLADLVAAGEITDVDANARYVAAADRWNLEG